MIDEHAPGNMQFIQLSKIAIRNIRDPGSLWQERCEILFFLWGQNGPKFRLHAGKIEVNKVIKVK